MGCCESKGEIITANELNTRPSSKSNIALCVTKLTPINLEVLGDKGDEPQDYEKQVSISKFHKVALFDQQKSTQMISDVILDFRQRQPSIQSPGKSPRTKKNINNKFLEML